MNPISNIYKLLLAICVLFIIQGPAAIAQSGKDIESMRTSYKDSFSTNVSQGDYFQFGLYYGVIMPLGSYHDITQSRGGSPDFQPAYIATFDRFWSNIGIGVEAGYFSNKYERAPYTANVAHFDVIWDREKWSNLFFGIGPSFSLNRGREQYQITIRGGVMRTKTPVYKSFFTLTHPDVLELEYPSSTLLSAYGSVSLKTNYIISKNFTLSLLFSYTISMGADYTYKEIELIDYDGDGGYSLDEIKSSPILDNSISVKPEILTIGLGINYRFL